jgi:hypothetical protein
MANWVLAACLAVAACSPSDGGAGGDGVLDCSDGQIEQSAGITASGVAEAEVAKVALKGWAVNGATVKEFPEAGSWSAVLGGSDIAVAVAVKGDDTAWTVTDVRVCGVPEAGG